MTVDPFLSLIVGAFGAALIGLLGAVIQSRREHKRWIRERRYEAFVQAYALIKSFDLNWLKQMKLATEQEVDMDDPELQKLFEQADQLYTTVAQTLAPSIILGPDSVTKHVLAMQLAFENYEVEGLGETERDFVEAARKVLKIDS
jgi:hypothetical protein